MYCFCKASLVETVVLQEFYWRSHVPAFGSWDCNDDLPFTQCFESARQAGLLRYSYSEDRDLYVAGDLYENDVVTPAMIVVPRRRVSPTTPDLFIYFLKNKSFSVHLYSSWSIINFNQLVNICPVLPALGFSLCDVLFHMYRTWYEGAGAGISDCLCIERSTWMQFIDSVPCQTGSFMDYLLSWLSFLLSTSCIIWKLRAFYIEFLWSLKWKK